MKLRKRAHWWLFLHKHRKLPWHSLIPQPIRRVRWVYAMYRADRAEQVAEGGYRVWTPDAVDPKLRDELAKAFDVPVKLIDPAWHPIEQRRKTWRLWWGISGHRGMLNPRKPHER